MSFGNFAGGVVQGGLAVAKQYNEDQKLKIEQDHADQEQYLFDRKKELDDSLKDISTRENAAANQAAPSVNANAPDVNVPSVDTAAVPDAIKSPVSDTPVSDSTADSLPSAVANQDQVNESNIPKTIVDSGSASGITPDAVNRYRFALERSRAYQNAGDWQTAQNIKKTAQTDAAGDFANAIINGDRHTAFGLYDTHPNGHSLKSLDFDKDGNMVTEDENGFKKITPKIDALIGTIAQSGDPDKAVSLITSRMNSDDKDEMAKQMLKNKIDMANMALDYKKQGLDNQMAIAKMQDDRGYMGMLFRALNKGNGSGDGSSSNGGAGKLPYGYKMDDFGAIDPANPNSMLNRDTGVKTYMDLLKYNPNLNTPENAATAKWLATDHTMGSSPKTAQFNNDGTWGAYIQAGSNKYLVQPNVDPASQGYGFDGANAKFILPTIMKSQPAAYSIAYKSLNGDTSGYAAVQQAARANPGDVAQQQQLQLLNNIRSNITRFKTNGVPNPLTPAQNAPAAPLTTDQQTARDTYSMDKENPVVTTVKQSVANTKNYLANQKAARASEQIDTDVNYLRSIASGQVKPSDGMAPSATASRLKQAIQANPELIQQYGITQQELTAINSAR